MMEIILIVLIFLALAVGVWLGVKLGKFIQDKHWEKEILKHRKDAVVKSRAVLAGQFSEQICPYFPDFEFSPSECRFIGKPVDFIVFKGADGKEIEEVVFVEVKGGKSKLNGVEKSLKEAVENGKVRWKEYRIPDDVFYG